MSNNGIGSFFQFQRVNWPNMWGATWETIWVTVVSMIAVIIFGVLLGLLLFETRDSTSTPVKILNWIVAAFVNIFRSIPFIILIVLMLPATQALVGTIMGPRAALPSLILSASPFYARMVEVAFTDLDHGEIEMARATGATEWQIITKVLIPETMPALVSNATVTTISLIGYTAMAGAIGAGGLGNLAYLDGFQDNNNTVTLVATVIIVIIVFIFQFIGDTLSKKLDKR